MHYTCKNKRQGWKKTWQTQCSIKNLHSDPWRREVFCLMSPDVQGCPIWIIILYKWIIHTDVSSFLLLKKKKWKTTCFSNLLDRKCVGVFNGRFRDRFMNPVCNMLVDQIVHSLSYIIITPVLIHHSRQMSFACLHQPVQDMVYNMLSVCICVQHYHVPICTTSQSD